MRGLKSRAFVMKIDWRISKMLRVNDVSYWLVGGSVKCGPS